MQFCPSTSRSKRATSCRRPQVLRVLGKGTFTTAFEVTDPQEPRETRCLKVLRQAGDGVRTFGSERRKRSSERPNALYSLLQAHPRA